MSSLFRDGALLPEGQHAELQALRLLSGLGNVKKIEDVRTLRDWQAKEIDFRATMTDGSVRGIEVKSDAHIDRTGNVLFELARIHHTSPTTCAYLGWSVFSQADYMLVYTPASRVFRLFTFPSLRAVMQRYTQEKRGDTQVAWIASDATRSTLNLLIPLVEVPHWRYVPAGNGWRLEKTA